MTGVTEAGMTVGQVAERFAVTVRTLHHYDEIGLLRPSRRTAAGYRLYTDADVTRLQHVIVYRRLGFALDEIAEVLDDPDADVASHLRRQRDAVMSRLDELSGLVVAIDRALEAEMSGIRLTREEQQELFGDGFSEEYQAEARERWGDTEEWKQSQARTAQYTKADWEAIKAETDAVNDAFVAAKRSGAAPDSEAGLAAADAHGRHIHDRFYDLSPEMHLCLARMYVADERFTAYYDDLEPGLAQYVHDAIEALRAT
ncbi:MerR family transcriptional regulator [Actinomycetospora endophytica]|uniref:MerR family transcriptional regulator n=1 Tax=Actinomycetospora endophytica TaxID=2291215 RepID=A0ABS8PB45_9PSEU|nr:MerR family transcriptional regulator [Actinomycetospora endophytica]MCD2195481.1 MerR family transcriptional regulator [Actinomycetospora endophytica]